MTEAAATDTPVLLSPTPLPPPLPSTATPVPCDPEVTYCIQGSHFLLQRPIVPPGKDAVDPTYRYGSTQKKTRQPHHGVEFYNPSSTPVFAAADGTVVYAGNDKETLFSPWPNFYGNLIVIEHRFDGLEQPVFTLYAHLSKIEVSAGETVSTSQKIGEVGMTGSALGSHLHFEVRVGENAYTATRNPELWLIPRSNADGRPCGALAGRIENTRGEPLRVNLRVQYYPEPTGVAAMAYDIETYAPEEQPVGADDIWLENFALSDLHAGQYRITFVYMGVLYERWVEVEEEQVTLVTFAVK